MLRALKPKQLSEKHEAFIAEELDGRTQIASGALYFAKGDVETKDYLIECKATQKPYYIIKKKILNKIDSEATKIGKIPLLAIRVKEQDFIMFKFWDFKQEDDYESILCYIQETAKVDFRNVDFSKTVEYTVWVDGEKWELCELSYFKEIYT